MIFPHLAIRAVRRGFFSRSGNIFSITRSTRPIPFIPSKKRTRRIVLVHLRFLVATFPVNGKSPWNRCGNLPRGPERTKEISQVPTTFKICQSVTTLVIGPRNGSNFPIGRGMISDYREGGRKNVHRVRRRFFAEKN